jgi:hypothetical protein
VRGRSRSIAAAAALLLPLLGGAAAAGEDIVLPPYFHESWRLVTLQPLQTVSLEAQASPIETAKAALPAIMTEGVPTPPGRPVVTPGPAAYASLAPQDRLVTTSLPDIPTPTRRPKGIDLPLTEGDAADAEPAVPPVKVAALGAMPGAGMAIGALAELSALPPIAKGSCSVGKPYRVSALGPASRLALKPAATLDLDMVHALVPWEAGLQAIARETLGEPIAEVQVAASYDCRTMNHRRRARLSEHSQANALDVSVFRTASGKEISVSGYHRGGAGSAFLRKVRGMTCDRFQVVLGPGSDGMHEDHFHMDLGRWKACR